MRDRRLVLAFAGAALGWAAFGPGLALAGVVLGVAISSRRAVGPALATAALVATALYAVTERSLGGGFASIVDDHPLTNTAGRLAWLAWTLAITAGWTAVRAARQAGAVAADLPGDDATPLVAREGRTVPARLEPVVIAGTVTALAFVLLIGDRTWAWLAIPVAVGTAVLLAAVHLPRLLHSDWTAIVRLLPGQPGDDERTDDVVHGSVWMLAGTAAVALGSFAFWIVAARTATQDSVGGAAALFSVVTFLNYASSLGLPIALSRMGGEEAASVLFTWMLVLTTLSSFVAIGVFAGLAPGSVVSALGGSGTAGWLVLALMVAGMSLSVLVDVRCMTLRLWRWVFWRSVAISVVRVPFLFAVPDGDATLYLFVLIAGAYGGTGLVALAGLLGTSKERLRLRPAPPRWRATARFATVNYAGQLAIQAPFFVLPIIVLASLTAEENASFYVAWGIMSVVVISVQLVGQVLLVEGGRAERSGQARVALAVALAVSVVSLALVVVLASMIRAVYGDGYEQVSVLLVLLVGGTVPYSAIVVGLNATRVSMDNRATIVITFAFAALVLLPALVLTNGNGATGAAWAWLLGNCAAAIVVAGVHRRRIGGLLGRATPVDGTTAVPPEPAVSTAATGR